MKIEFGDIIRVSIVVLFAIVSAYQVFHFPREYNIPDYLTASYTNSYDVISNKVYIRLMRKIELLHMQYETSSGGNGGSYGNSDIMPSGWENSSSGWQSW